MSLLAVQTWWDNHAAAVLGGFLAFFHNGSLQATIFCAVVVWMITSGMKLIWNWLFPKAKL